MASQNPEAYMREAIAIAELGYTAPNPMVGCLIVNGSQIVGAGYHRMAGFPHAEAEALVQAGDLARGAEVFVTLEPCSHHGRTPPCCDALIEAGVSRVWIASRDASANGGGAERLSAAGIAVEIGLLAKEAEMMNAIWLTNLQRGRPFVTLKAAITLDGKIALRGKGDPWITGEESRRVARRLRAQHGAVLVGRGTVEIDDPELTVRDVEMMEPPLRLVLDPGRKLAEEHKVFNRGEAPVHRVVAEGLQREGDIAAPVCDGELDLSAVLNALHEKGVPGLLVEGGAATYRSFINQRLVDRIDLFVAPKWFGSGLNWVEDVLELSSAQLSLVHQQRSGDDVWLRYDVKWP